MNKIKYIFSGLVAVLPLSVMAASDRNLKTFAALLADYMNTALELLMGFAVLAFVFYIVKYFIAANDKHEEASQYLLWSVIGFFIILSLWGIVNILIGTFDLGTPAPGTWTNLKSLFPTN